VTNAQQGIIVHTKVWVWTVAPHLPALINTHALLAQLIQLFARTVNGVPTLLLQISTKLLMKNI
jgi:hypothetical protein